MAQSHQPIVYETGESEMQRRWVQRSGVIGKQRKSVANLVLSSTSQRITAVR